MTLRDLVYWSLIFILFWLLISWCKWRYWEYLRQKGDHDG